MSAVDLTLVVIAHDETAVCGPTMRAADLAVAAARAAGHTVQTVIALHHATDATRGYFQQPRFDHWERRSFDQGERSEVVNEMVAASAGRYVAFLGADDLVGENWLAAAVTDLHHRAERGEAAIAHPELHATFDVERSVVVNVDQDSPLFVPHQLYVRSVFDAVCVAPREAHVVPHRQSEVANALGFGERYFAAETMSQGWRHVVVRDTVVFERRRDPAPGEPTGARSPIMGILPELAIDRVARPGNARATRAGDTSRLGKLRRRVREAFSAQDGDRPELPVHTDPTHLGPVMDRIVARVRGRARPQGVDPEYDELRENFDHLHFMLQATHMLEQPRVDPVGVFLRNGAKAKASPNINFSMPAYLARHPERAEGPERSPYLAWVKQGWAAGEIADPAPGLEPIADVLGLSAKDVACLLAETRNDLAVRLRNGTLGEMFAKASEIEPLIGALWPKTASPVVLPFASEDESALVAALHDCQRRAGFRTARAVIMINRPRWGGGRRAEGYLAHALASGVGADEIVVLYTDYGGPTPQDRFPAGVREIHLADSVEQFGVVREDAQLLLVELLRSFTADVIVNINATLFYEALPHYGRALARSERIFHVMFCNDQGPRGNWNGHPAKHFYPHIDTATGVITDSHYLNRWLIDTYCLSDEYAAKLHVFSAPVDLGIPLASAPAPVEGRRPQVFWAGRIDRQKRPELVFEIARRLPAVDIRMWGEGVAQQLDLKDVPDNVHLEGSYAGFHELDLSVADAWLYTSGWDGVPSQLLEVAMTGVPVVGSLVGGTGELLPPGEAWPISDIDDPGAYAAALQQVLDDPAAARAGARALRERVIAERTESAYAEQSLVVLLPGAR
ncbi:MAG: glycosyltransferase family 4 protein [Nocardioides sp.]